MKTIIITFLIASLGLASELDANLFAAIDKAQDKIGSKVEAKVCINNADKGGKKALEDYKTFKKCAKNISKDKKKVEALDKFISKTEVFLIGAMRKEKNPKKLRKIRKALIAIRTGKKVGEAWKKLPPAFQDLIARMFHNQMKKKLKKYESQMKIKIAEKKEVVTILGMDVPKDQLANALNLISDNIDSVEKKLKEEKGLYSKINFNNLDELKNNPEKAEKIKEFLRENLTQDDQNKLEALYKNAKTELERTDIKLKLLNLYKTYQNESGDEVASNN